ncbi:MAG: copper amine oxidase N-terminal domain-containing protein [Oscillospiraceae bacterium]|nr:copper amine oxidase N-terminal domain-containing protein [Oscillospiraceae bacterium]
MKLHKLIFTLIIAIATLTAVNAAAEEIPAVLYNGVELTLDSEPVVVNGRTLVPFRSLFEQMGAEISYDDADRIITAEIEGNEIRFSLDAADINVNSSAEPSYTMDVLPTVIDGRTYVPVRAVCEAAGFDVNWATDECAVLITNYGAIQNEIRASFAALPTLRRIFENPAKVYTQHRSIHIIPTAFQKSFRLDIEGDITSDKAACRAIYNIELGLNEEALGEETEYYYSIFFPDGKLSMYAEFIMTDDAIFMRTDMADVIPKLFYNYEEDPVLSHIMEYLPSGQWLGSDMSEFLNGEAIEKDEPMLFFINMYLPSIINRGIGIDPFEWRIDNYLARFASYVQTSYWKPTYAEEERTIPLHLENVKSILGGDSITAIENSDGTATVTVGGDAVKYITGGEYAVNMRGIFQNGIAVELESRTTNAPGEVTVEKTVGTVGGEIEKIELPKAELNLAEALRAL